MNELSKLNKKVRLLFKAVLFEYAHYLNNSLIYFNTLSLQISIFNNKSKSNKVIQYKFWQNSENYI